MKPLYASLGVVSVALGIIGVFVPGLPTTVFVIAASYLFARSSPRLERWLEGNRWLGPSLSGSGRRGVCRARARWSRWRRCGPAWASASTRSLASVSSPDPRRDAGNHRQRDDLFAVRTTEVRRRLIMP